MIKILTQKCKKENLGNIGDHISTVDNRNVVNCDTIKSDQCDRSFKSMEALDIHNQLKHGGLNKEGHGNG